MRLHQISVNVGPCTDEDADRISLDVLDAVLPYQEDAVVSRTPIADELDDSPSDDEMADRPGVEGGIGYPLGGDW